MTNAVGAAFAENPAVLLVAAACAFGSMRCGGVLSVGFARFAMGVPDVGIVGVAIARCPNPICGVVLVGFGASVGVVFCVTVDAAPPCALDETWTVVSVRDVPLAGVSLKVSFIALWQLWSDKVPGPRNSLVRPKLRM